MIGNDGIGPDPTGKQYALVNGMYFIGYVNWSEVTPFLHNSTCTRGL
jgi:hypothetical protein